MISNVRLAHFGTAVDDRRREADAITLPRLVDAGAHPRPSTIGSTYVEHEYAALMDEQREAWAAWGEEQARAHDARAHSLRLKTTSLEFLLAEAGREVQAAQAAYEHAARLLMSYVRREPGTKLRYWLGWLVLVLGDTAGVWSAAVMNGDVPYIAFGQALAAGFAAACAGLVGTELKDMRLALARRREPETLTEDERLYRRLFTAPTGGTRVIKLVGLLSALVVGLVAIGIFTLRASVEGSTTGTTFGLLAAGTAVASGLLCYSAADEVADLLATMRKRVRSAEQRYTKVAASRAFKIKAASEETASSLRREAAYRGAAAARQIESLCWRVLRNNPHVVGHGYAAGENGEAIGWRVRRGGTS